MLNPILRSTESDCIDSLDSHLSRRKDRWRADTQVNPIKILMAGISKCSVAHWYFMPGLTFHRHWVRLALSTIVSGRKELRNAIASALDRTISPTAFLDFDFAWRAVTSREFIGAYLDCSSPWLFPAMLLAKGRCESAMLLGSDAPGVEVLRQLARDLRQARCRTIFRSVNEAGAIAESFDVATSLSWLARTADDVGTLRMLWGALKRGGMLLLSLPCATRRVEGRQRIGSAPSLTQLPETLRRRLYNESMLQERIFEVIGQPRRSVVYGESNSGAYRDFAIPGRRHVYSLREYLAVARGWRTYPRLRDLPGEGLIAMKFIKA